MALAPQHAAIGIRRHFTAEGVHPYDLVEWERRDARIIDWRTGAVAFEQLGVEVPASWSVNATNILAQKYFRGHPGSPTREWSLKQVVDRIADTITAWGDRDGYFAGPEELHAFRDELKHLMVTQRVAFNSPVWFNIGVPGARAQSSACFILAVDDTMESILNWYAEEGRIFKGGSGAGVNLSTIRGSKEHLAGGGTASGPVSFMRGADASAGTIKSGGTTRRAAKMVILDADHPDIEEFIWCKAIEERKARVLRDAGFDMDLDGADGFSIQYQNANNSVRLTDEFMQAVLADGDWQTRARLDGSVVQTVKARDIMRQISEAAWECADPGLQFDTTINRWHTAANTGRITASNPCFPASARVHTDKGLVRFDELFARANAGETFGIYTHEATNVGAPADRVEITSPDALMITGFKDIVRLAFDNGMELRCTPNHRLFTTNRGWVEAGELTADDRVKTLDVPAPPIVADLRLPVSTDVGTYARVGDHTRPVRLPEKWTPEFARYLGWLVGDGSTSGTVTSSIYGSAADRDEILPSHRELLEWVNGDRPLKPGVQQNGTVQLRIGRRVFKAFVEALGVRSVTAAHKTVPWSIAQAPHEIAAAFLRGLFDADGCAVLNKQKGSYAGLGSVSIELLRGVQTLLTTFGISSRIYKVRSGAESGAFPYTRRDGTSVTYRQRASYDLRITGRSLDRFASQIGFSLSPKQQVLDEIVSTRRSYAKDSSIRLVERVEDGHELTYDLTESRNHSFIVDGIVVHNCSEYLSLDNSACNLASLNVLRFLDGEDAGSAFDAEAFKAAVEVTFTAQEILVGNSEYPTDKIGETTRAFRQIGLGYTNLGASLMALGLPYDSDEGRAFAGTVTALMTGQAYLTSARIASRMGPFAGFHANREPMLRVLDMHRDAAADIDEELVDTELLSAAQCAWDDAVDLARQLGVRNSQATVLAPTGCLVGGSLVATDRGLVRLRSLGDPDGATWQDADLAVQTDEGPRRATKFYVNGLDRVVDVVTVRGYELRGTTTHRIKIVQPDGSWAWRRFADLRPGDRVPLALDQLVGEPRHVWLPPIGEPHWLGEHHVDVPRSMNPELAELVGYFMGDGSLHSRGLRFCVDAQDFDVVERLCSIGKSLFKIEAKVVPKGGYIEVAFHSVRLVAWWEACGFAKHSPAVGHRGKGWHPHIPDAVLHSNDRETYRAFVRGLFEADGTVSVGNPAFGSSHLPFSQDVQNLLLALGFATRRKFDVSGRGSRMATLRIVNRCLNEKWQEEIGFISGRKRSKVDVSDLRQGAKYDHVPVTRELIDRVAPIGNPYRKVALMEFRRSGTVTRRWALRMLDLRPDYELRHLLSFTYDTIVSAEMGTEELTYDLSVPDNVTYLANGFVSHNTISFVLDCDTTGVEPDLGLVKTKKLVGGGSMSIVNQTVPRALRRLGYSAEAIEQIVAHIAEHNSILGAPGLDPEHLPVFACSMGDNVIHYRGHLGMLAAVQPFISGSVSKTVNVPEETTVEEIEALHIEAWQSGIKCVAIYRDNCKVGQPLSVTKKAGATTERLVPDAVHSAAQQVVERVVERVSHEPVRCKMPRSRVSRTFEFRVADCKGFVTVGEYEDGRPGEIFVRVSKQGSTLAGIMDAFAISISHGLQYGVPLRAFVEAFVGMRFEPAGMTDDPDIRIASSLLDYLFRRLAVEYMGPAERAELNILTTGERTQPTLPGVEEAVTETSAGSDIVPDPPSLWSAATEVDLRPDGPGLAVDRAAADAPLCMTCGIHMQRAGSCYVCHDCGMTSGCS